MKNLYLIRSIGWVLSFLVGNNLLFAQSFTENFDNIATLPGSGWVQQNNSAPVGTINWFQGNPASFNAYNGATSSYIAANFNNTGATGTISNWLMTPNRTFKNGDVITFYTRKASPSTWADRMEVRLSSAGASTFTGVAGTGTGDFSTVLLTINPTLNTVDYPMTWTQYSITISGLSAPTSGRIAFRYFVTNAGSSGTNSDYIGIDNVVYTEYICPTLTMTAGGALSSGTAGSIYSSTLTQTGALGAPNFTVTSGSLPSGLSLASNGTISGTPTATGTFNFSVTVNDNSGCSTSQSYSISIVCPANPTSLNGLPTLCTNGSNYTLIQGMPAGGTYSGTGVIGNTFNPSVGTQSITYSYTDPYSCAHSTISAITVNNPPSVSLSAFSSVCSNSNLLTLSGGLPAGGTYSGVGVSGGQFNPNVGSQTITYSYTDGNSCSASASSSIVVNSAPVVSHSPIANVCENAGLVSLTGGSPAGGVYSGTGLSGSNFDPTAGTQTINYTYIDGNNCSGISNVSITVNPAPIVSHNPISDICENSGMLNLPGGTPAGGTYSGTGITGNDFDPSAGTQSITYTYIDGQSCSGQTTFTVSVISSDVATLSPFSSVCSNSGVHLLTGGLPVGGVYSGIGVSGSNFDPSVGTQTITYTLAPGTACESSVNEIIVVNIAPSVLFTLNTTELCVYNNSLVLSGGTPSNGVYSGAGVSGNNFDPAVAGIGTTTITYTFLDGNNCSASAMDIITVDACLGLEETEISLQCSVYPNPNDGSFIVLGLQEILSFQLEVRDISGKLIPSTIQGISLHVLDVNIENKSTGIYFLTGIINNETVKIRFIIN